MELIQRLLKSFYAVNLLLYPLKISKDLSFSEKASVMKWVTQRKMYICVFESKMSVKSVIL